MRLVPVVDYKEEARRANLEVQALEAEVRYLKRQLKELQRENEELGNALDKFVSVGDEYYK